ncbi:MAG: hypothetical protein NXH78_15820 [Hyphomonadaceae bacterium]|nr:hypothetical protein [Hyphomonadaceae bacterium]
MGSDPLIDREMPQWTKSLRRHAHFSQSIETEEMADAELDIQVDILKAMTAKAAESPVDMLLKLKLWESFVSPNGEIREDDIESQLILSVIKDLEAFMQSGGGSMTTYAQAS